MSIIFIHIFLQSTWKPNNLQNPRNILVPTKLTPNMARRSGSRKRKGMLLTCSRLAWLLLCSLMTASARLLGGGGTDAVPLVVTFATPPDASADAASGSVCCNTTKRYTVLKSKKYLGWIKLSLSRYKWILIWSTLEWLRSGIWC